MNKREFFFDVDKNPKICLNKKPTDNEVLSNCEYYPNKKHCCDSYKGEIDSNKVTKITGLSSFKSYKDDTKDRVAIVETNFNKKDCKDQTDEFGKNLKKLIGVVESVEVNQRLLRKQYNELIFSPNEVINVDETKIRYLELDRKLEKYDKKTYALYKNFFYIMLITSGILFIRKQIKK